jgi:hypothetical protein
VTVGKLALFSTDTGDAWLLDPEDHLAARLARDGDPEDVYFDETDTRFAIGWKEEFRIDGTLSFTLTGIPVASSLPATLGAVSSGAGSIVISLRDLSPAPFPNRRYRIGRRLPAASSELAAAWQAATQNQLWRSAPLP